MEAQTITIPPKPGQLFSLSSAKPAEIDLFSGGVSITNAVMRRIEMVAKSVAKRGLSKKASALSIATFALMSVMAERDESPDALADTDDGGLTLEFTAERTGREVLFAVPKDGSAFYFAAHDGTRRLAGTLKGLEAVIGFATWLRGGELPEKDIVLG